MIISDGTLHTCHKYGKAVCIIDGKMDWQSDKFREGKKEIYSDF